MVTVVELLSLLLVSVLWGCTNPFLKRGSAGIEDVSGSSRTSQLLAEVKFLFLNTKYLVPFLLNQCGSLVYYYTLSTAELSFVVPVANSLTFLCTLLTGKLLGEEFGGKRKSEMSLILIHKLVFLYRASHTDLGIKTLQDTNSGKCLEQSTQTFAYSPFGKYQAHVRSSEHV
ncbi:transmembrane protein 234 isoform X1 [Hippoglossus hippoglossus]|uniref:transmembrane protein 234 isoform X1 n=1 Tax=Hippoglossus hippoglossus TaxID=8267 RepID=UPI00148D659F|nr:transmembrane protein 234 isoform X1 [Hippoglossus hippoglossus]